MARPTIPALRIGGLLLGAALVALLIHRTGIGTIGAALSRVGPSFFWLVAAYTAATAIAAFPWGMLIPIPARPSWIAVIASRFVASGVNVLLPFFGIGEAGRLLWIAKPAWPLGTAAIVADRLLFIAAGAFVILAAVGAARHLPGVPPIVDLGGALLALALIAASIAIGALAARGKLARRGARLLRRLGVRRPSTVEAESATNDGDGGGQSGPAAPSWDQALRDLLAGPARRLLAGLAVHVVARLLFALEIYAGLRVLGLPAGWRETIILSAVPIALSVVGAFVPGQIGIQEACQSLVGAAVGIGPAAGLTLVLLQRARQLLFIPLSGLLMAVVPLRKRAAISRV